ncbi:DNA internalization-related competence protein ComEC/Rec2 [Vagococcus acidifermentans]|uniref:DNA internalization-related competence protein ComEC/Rec2 n=2 Tax=Vagococcus acidifermentans TaxID=564710 RepID=A0A430B0K7_9ENTE|nr:DNA internalization-related competence protein ComEC/Rec2 [Vagococcus acidifermentans]
MTMRFSTDFSLKGYLIFPMGTIAAVCAVFSRPHWLSWLLLIIVVLKVCSTRRKELILSALFGGLFACLVLAVHGLADDPKEQEFPANRSAMITAHVRPDSIAVTGDRVQFIMQELNSGTPLMGYYTFQNKQEKEKWAACRDWLTVTAAGNYDRPRGRRNLSGFNHREYLSAKGIQTIFRINRIDSAVKRNVPPFHVLAHSYRLRRICQLAVDRHFPEYTSAYLNCLLFGLKDDDFKDMSEQWELLGIVHLFSLSGMHLFVFLRLFSYLFLRSGITKETVFWLELCAICCFMVMGGAGSGLVRAGIQTALLRANRRYQWQLSSLDCFALTLAGHSLWYPDLLLTAGGQLSYFMTFCLMMSRDSLAHIKRPLLRQFAFSAVMTGCSLPFVWHYFHDWQVFSLLFGVLLAPLVLYVLFPLLLGAFIVSWVWQGIGGSMPVNVLEASLQALQSAITYLTHILPSKFVVGRAPLFLTLVMIFLIVCLLRECQRKSRRPVLIAGLCAGLLAAGNWKYLSPQGMIAFVDVGQGDAIFIQLPFHQGNYLIDTGGRLNFEQEAWRHSKRETSNADYTLIPFLKSRGVSRLETVFITHADADHSGDLQRVAESFQIKTLAFPQGAAHDDVLARTLFSFPQTTDFQQLKAGATLYFGRFPFKVLSPQDNGSGDNNGSLVLYGAFKDTTFLLTGDIEKEVEAQLITDYPGLTADVLKVAHHGSDTSSSPAFLAHIRPREGIISAGYQNRHGHPTQRVLAELHAVGSSIYRTDEHGMVYYTWLAGLPGLSPPKTAAE